jgi:hypothetical protein
MLRDYMRTQPPAPPVATTSADEIVISPLSPAQSSPEG